MAGSWRKARTRRSRAARASMRGLRVSSSRIAPPRVQPSLPLVPFAPALARPRVVRGLRAAGLRDFLAVDARADFLAADARAGFFAEALALRAAGLRVLDLRAAVLRV